MRVLVTTERQEPLATLLAAGGASVVHVPLLETVRVVSAGPTTPPTLALVTSAATVRHAPSLPRVLAHASVVAVGEKTAQALRAVGITPVAVGAEGGAAAVALLADHSPGAAVLHVGAETLSRPLERALTDAPRTVERWVVYRRQAPEGVGGCLSKLRVDAVAFASGSAARTFARHWQGRRPAVVVLGPTTAAEAAEAGLVVEAEARCPSLEALAEAVLALSP